MEKLLKSIVWKIIVYSDTSFLSLMFMKKKNYTSREQLLVIIEKE